ncbi:aldehyde dehydrogenase family protein [Deinococcus maricopensis]|uniref:Aldehyde dehydrogenase n=1 Tax=Deinococcus maricopensis (strain DSM 21211 / LMG 22137 / NRRL B-23946 / LB-34) TaxID=709986 RepID=E8U6H2_DEIML|nr:aldehyde dehydrogenase family protein [Deinococcus maricopensis]ADV66661.1 Aldehyde Dehydrogenase [Deinococcus maricopensis DSM 21211]
MSSVTAPDRTTPLQALYDAQRTYAPTIAARTARERAATLARLGHAVDQHRARLAQALHLDLGKSRAEAEITELHPLRGEIQFARRHVARWMHPRRVGTPPALGLARSEVRATPRGVTLILSPWNYPVNLTLVPLASAIAAGNPVILKPSEKAPHTARALRALIEDTFDPREVALVEGEADVATALLDLPFDHVFFTGSTRVGRLVMEAASRHLAAVTLELGGKSPAIVDESADIERAAERIAWGKFLNAGQTCVAPDYVLVHERVRDELLLALTVLIERRFGGRVWQRVGPDYGRMVDACSVDRLEALTLGSVRAGARVVAGGTFDAARRFISPTLVVDVTPDMPLMREELFGPVLPILTYRTLAEATALVRAGDAPLALYVFAGDAAAEQVLRDTTSGGAVVNGTVAHLANPHLPFGGVGASGQGRYHGEFGFRAFSHERAVLREPPLSPVRLLYPPYGRLGPRLGAWLMRVLS